MPDDDTPSTPDNATRDDSSLHVVCGFGQVGRALVVQLVSEGKSVRVVTHHQPSAPPNGVEIRVADVTDEAAARRAASGASVIYQCLNAPYTQWPTLFPPLQKGVIAAAQQTGALLVSLENVYGYGPTDGRAMTEELALHSTTTKGRARAAMTEQLFRYSDAGRIRMTIGRAADFFGAGVTDSTLGERVFAHAVGKKKADFVGNPRLLHTYSYVPDIARGLATLGEEERAVGEVWHLPGPETVTTRELLDLVALRVGHPVDIRVVGKPLLALLGLVNPLMKGLAEMSYEFDEPFVLDTTKFQSTFGTRVTPLKVAVDETVAWYQSRGSGK
ncbi:MAG: NAD-dependent epimerase/dehydratase family protein [Acidimicrobiaceae bacterium]|nr:NAD-dependent epimerase/dehydratase family protein [Acidimicrobiaceae bacterium]